MWVLAEYQPATLYSLRSALATTSGGKSLIVPTAFSIKMALLDATMRTQGATAGRTLFAALRDLRIAVRPPEQIVVNSTFTKVLRLKEFKMAASEKPAAIEQAKASHQWPFQKTIAYREYVQYGGPLILGFSGMSADVLAPLLLQINYLGKRGGFIQLQRAPEVTDALPGDLTELTADIKDAFPLGVLQMVDDFGPAMTFEHADIYSKKGITLGKERVLRHVMLPYKMTRSSRSYTLYERFET